MKKQNLSNDIIDFVIVLIAEVEKSLLSNMGQKHHGKFSSYQTFILVRNK